MSVHYSINYMGPINTDWIKHHGEGWSAGRIDIYGDGLYPDEIGLPPMKSEDWGRFSNWNDRKLFDNLISVLNKEKESASRS